MSSDSSHRPVYSTDHGELCADCGKPTPQCCCASLARAAIKGDGKVRVRRETNGRGGKIVTTISGLALNDAALRALLKDLQKLCGAGGAVKGGVIEVQGDHGARVMQELAKRGVSAQLAGG